MPQLEELEHKQIAMASITTGPEPGTISVVGRENGESSELARVSTLTSPSPSLRMRSANPAPGCRCPC